ncbi:SAM-dependent methyltransferase [Massilistercora timonensis]|uniref:class I SAM-dependent methyltransferase n=1 Tax=Massilistercora timonensis TaxID=2086584 RepID=UPI0032098AEA
MDELRTVLEDNLNSEFLLAVLSNPRRADGPNKVRIRPVRHKDRHVYQFEAFCGTQVFHQNLEKEEACGKILEYMENFRQMQLETQSAAVSALVSKKGKVTVKKKLRAQKKAPAETDHNRKKHYILEEGIPVPFLQDLGVMTAEGKIVRTKFDKFRQINRFLEFIQDVLPKLPREREIRILDFGCGKSYLTFAMYYYLHELQGLDVRILGLDLKEDVIRACNQLSQRYGYEKLRFLEGNIADYTGADEVDMVVTLHACDTATDFALAKAVGWKAKVILSVPCCQHELNGQMENELLRPILQYGLIKERLAALVTDGLRAQYLEREGYDVQVLEFIDMEHTPKNILLRAVRTGRKGENGAAIQACEEFFHVSPTLGKLLDHKGDLQ